MDFDEINFQVAFNDTDYCMRVRAAGLKVIYTPFATMYHYESKSRGLAGESEREREEARRFTARWRDRLNDPFYNSHFDRYARPYRMLRVQGWTRR